jgi:2-aminoethylphosphonate-pyruvate transaminase
MRALIWSLGTDSVKFAQVVSDICPREKEFGDLMGDVSRDLTSFVADPNDYTTVLIGGSGTAAIEATLSSVVGTKKILIVENGAYGTRMSQIAAIHSLDYGVFKSSSVEPIDHAELEKTLKSGGFGYLAVVHSETTTGLLNDLEPIGKLCRAHSISLIVDAMSSYGAIPIDMKALNIDYLVASSNKNIQGMAGVGFTVCRTKALQNTKDNPKKTLYLDLYAQYEYFERTNQLRFTPPVQTLYALKQAILETKEETIAGRYARYSKSWKALLSGVEKLGLTYLVSPEHQSRIITSIRYPENVPHFTFDGLHQYMAERGYTIYPGKIGDQDTFRIANIGAIDSTDIEKFIGLLEEYLSVG